MPDPLLPELKAAEARHSERQDELRRRGWGRTPPITRSDIANWTLDRWELKNGRNVA